MFEHLAHIYYFGYGMPLARVHDQNQGKIRRGLGIRPRWTVVNPSGKLPNMRCGVGFGQFTAE